MSRTRKTPRNPRRRNTSGAVPQRDATAREILAWVGDDVRRAQAAHDNETARGDEARSSLLTKLGRLGAVDRGTS